jgi:hypothetical protein
MAVIGGARETPGEQPQRVCFHPRQVPLGSAPPIFQKTRYAPRTAFQNGVLCGSLSRRGLTHFPRIARLIVDPLHPVSTIFIRNSWDHARMSCIIEIATT